MGVPIRLWDGTLYGTLCCLSRSSEPSLNDRDGRFLQVLADIVADQIDRQAHDATVSPTPASLNPVPAQDGGLAKLDPKTGAVIYERAQTGVVALMVPFAMVTAMGRNGMATGNVQEDGRYKVTNVPLGEVTIGLNTTGNGVDDPDQNFFENFSCKSERNYTGYCNPDIEKLFEAQSAETDIEKRRKIVWEADRKLLEDGARPVVMWNRAAICMQPYVKGYVPQVNSVYNGFRFEDVWLDR